MSVLHLKATCSELKTQTKRAVNVFSPMTEPCLSPVHLVPKLRYGDHQGPTGASQRIQGSSTERQSRVPDNSLIGFTQPIITCRCLMLHHTLAAFWLSRFHSFSLQTTFIWLKEKNYVRSVLSLSYTQLLSVAWKLAVKIHIQP